ncbi:hypothetical protein O6H91_14G020600 [Diphasiastrum complanatum]|uniref:Uncharacterized protein n=1 Tax=Diphasiastrum complanatum TaxID=34168 RepID=A0ACC2BM20_DIPCM|nr:hypothetical protein O6H91_14G020600 [Diphasiastrum complanatum]
MMGNRRGRQTERTLVCVVQALVGLELLVELRNELCIRGILDDCDADMNITLKDTVVENVEGIKSSLPMIFVRGSVIRFIHMPDTFNVSQAVEARRLMLDRAETAYIGGKGALTSTTSGESFKASSSTEEASEF